MFMDLPFSRRDAQEIAFFKDVESVLQPLGGRMTWSRLFFSDHQVVKSLYPKVEAMREVRDKLDPNHKFHNAFVERVLGE